MWDLVRAYWSAWEYQLRDATILLDVVCNHGGQEVCVADASWLAVCYQYAANAVPVELALQAARHCFFCVFIC